MRVQPSEAFGVGHEFWRSVTVVHTSDVHIGSTDRDRHHDRDGLDALAAVAEVVTASGADLLVLAGDTFDHARIDDSVIAEAVAILQSPGIDVVILPGNHDCLAADSPLVRAPIARAPTLHVLGVDSDCVALDELDVEVWGRAHRDHRYMNPMPDRLPPRRLRWRIVMAHGHWCESADDTVYGWPIEAAALARVDADYVALGHWDNRHAVTGSVPCHYSGAPSRSGSVNVLTLREDGAQEVVIRPL